METEGWSVRDACTARAFDSLLEQLSANGVELLTRHDSKVIERFEQAIEDVCGFAVFCAATKCAGRCAPINERAC